LLVRHTDARMESDKNKCQGADMCIMAEPNSSVYSEQSDLETPSVKITMGGMFGNYGGNDSSSELESRSLSKRLGLDACCNGIFDEPPRKREVIYPSQTVHDEKRQGANYASVYDAVMSAAEKAGMLRGDPPPAWYENPANLGTAVLAATPFMPFLVRGITNGIEWMASRNKCDNIKFYDAAHNTGTKFALLNEGSCSNEAIDQTIFEGIEEVLTFMLKSECKRCCARLTHGGGWSATLKIVAGSDAMDPGIINCEQTTKYNCKWNEDGPQPGCTAWKYHDEL